MAEMMADSLGAIRCHLLAGTARSLSSDPWAAREGVPRLAGLTGAACHQDVLEQGAELLEVSLELLERALKVLQR